MSNTIPTITATSIDSATNSDFSAIDLFVSAPTPTGGEAIAATIVLNTTTAAEIITELTNVLNLAGRLDDDTADHIITTIENAVRSPRVGEGSECLPR